MPTSEAQKQASAKYQREKVKRLTVSFYPSDADVWEYVCSLENKQGYIRDLIRADMERKQAE